MAGHFKPSDITAAFVPASQRYGRTHVTVYISGGIDYIEYEGHLFLIHGGGRLPWRIADEGASGLRQRGPPYGLWRLNVSLGRNISNIKP